MNIGVTEISPRAVQQAAEKNFKGGYYCCEALMCTIRDAFKLDVPKEVIAMSSGMAVEAGKSGCVCGAFNGGLLALGMFFGRTEQDGPTNPKSIKCMELTHELHEWFKEANGKNAICCRIQKYLQVTILCMLELRWQQLQHRHMKNLPSEVQLSGLVLLL